MLLIAPGVLVGTVWSEAAPAVQTLTEKDTGTSLTLKVGDRLVLDLRNPASGGYTNVSPLFDVKILKLVLTREIPPQPGPTPRLGDFGRIRLEFEAVGEGETEVVVQISRKWEKDKKPLEYTKNRVTVTR